MLTHSLARQQRGATLFLALIILVVMLLGGAALFRVVDSGMLVTGNIAMQRSATRSGDAAVEAAATWLSGAGSSLYNDNGSAGYIASGLAYFKGTNQTWAEYWSVLAGAVSPVTLAEDAAGNTSAYLIQRLCDQPGAPFSDGPPPVSCTTPPRGTSTGSSMGAGFIALNRPTGTYYRVLVRTTGTRGAVSYLQVMMYM
ncbi:hypothetical protein MASR1M60_06160 [Rhodocyclaceae bacterium]